MIFLPGGPAAWILSLLLATLILSPRTARAIEPCGATPDTYAGKAYGDVVHALSAPCSLTLDPGQQLFVAGMADHFMSACNLPDSVAERQRLLRFLFASATVANAGSDYSNPSALNTWRSQVGSMGAYGAGVAAASSMECGAGAESMASQIGAYIERTTRGRAGKPNFAQGCVEHYGGRYTQPQCQCIADIGMAIQPDIHSTAYQPSILKSLIERNPLVGLQIAFQCGIGDY